MALNIKILITVEASKELVRLVDWWMECGEDTQSSMLPDRTDLVHGHGLVDGVWRGYTVLHVA